MQNTGDGFLVELLRPLKWLFQFIYEEEEEEEEKIEVLADDSEIGDWILIEILRRIPLYSLFKFKCVSKRWLSLISDPSMALLYIPQGASYALLCRHIHQSAPREPLTLTIETHPNLESMNVPKLGFVPKEPVEDLLVVGSDNGLLLSYEWTLSQHHYYVSNPLTAQWVALPTPPMCHYRRPRGIGFIVGSINYKVIQVKKFGHFTLQLHSFDKGAMQWRSWTVSLSRPVLKVKGDLAPGVFYRGALHWAAGRASDSIQIIAYDPAKHELEGDDYRCRVFDGPPSNRVGRKRFKLGLSGGEVRFAEHITPSNQVNRGFIRLWLLKDYDSAEWCLEHYIDGLGKIMGFRSLVNGRVYDYSRFMKRYNCIGFWNFNPVDKDMLYFVAAEKSPNYFGLWIFNPIDKDIPSCRLSSYSISAQTVKHICTHHNINLPPYHFSNTRNQGIVSIFPTVWAWPFVLPPWPTPL